ncbi:unnamed protein product, partial [Rotaria sp. Silwood2]
RCAYNVIKEHAEIEKIKQKEKYDQHTTHRQYNEDDLVWVANPKAKIGENSMEGKLHSHYQGPCRLIQQLSPNTFTVCRLSDNINLGATNTDRLKPYIELNRNNQTTTKFINDQSADGKNTPTSISEDGPPPQYPERQKMKNNNKSPMYNQSSQRRVSNRHRKVPIRYVEN